MAFSWFVFKIKNLIFNYLFIKQDIGAQIGEYSLYVAKTGRKVLTVEPFHDNIVRIHKAAYGASLGDRITLIANAIYNKRGEIKKMVPVEKNLGAISLIKKKNLSFNKIDIKPNDPDAKYYVETILFDDITYEIPLKDDGTKFQKALMKLDIEVN